MPRYFGKVSQMVYYFLCFILIIFVTNINLYNNNDILKFETVTISSDFPAMWLLE